MLTQWLLVVNNDGKWWLTVMVNDGHIDGQHLKMIRNIGRNCCFASDMPMVGMAMVNWWSQHCSELISSWCAMHSFVQRSMIHEIKHQRSKISWWIMNVFMEYSCFFVASDLWLNNYSQKRLGVPTKTEGVLFLRLILYGVVRHNPHMSPSVASTTQTQQDRSALGPAPHVSPEVVSSWSHLITVDFWDVHSRAAVMASPIPYDWCGCRSMIEYLWWFPVVSIELFFFCGPNLLVHEGDRRRLGAMHIFPGCVLSRIEILGPMPRWYGTPYNDHRTGGMSPYKHHPGHERLGQPIWGWTGSFGSQGAGAGRWDPLCSSKPCHDHFSKATSSKASPLIVGYYTPQPFCLQFLFGTYSALRSE